MVRGLKLHFLKSYITKFNKVKMFQEDNLCRSTNLCYAEW